MQQINPCVLTTKNTAFRFDVVKSKYPVMKLHKLIFSATFLIITNSIFAQQQIPKVSVHFAFDKSDINASDLEALNKFKATYPSVESIIIDGYADTTGTDNYNYALSGRRCAVVKQALNYDSTKTEVFTVTAHGEKDLLFKTDPENRVVIVSVDPKRAAELRAARGEQTVQENKPLPVLLPDTVAKAAPAPAPKIDTPAIVSKPQPKELGDDASKLLDQLQNSKPGESVILKNILFQEGSHQLLKTSMPALNAMLSALKKMPSLELEIQGHMCCDDPLAVDGFDQDTKEFSLSYNRAKAVYDFFISNGIDTSRLTYKGFGTRKRLVYPEKTDNDRGRNRRVEFLITKK